MQAIQKPTAMDFALLGLTAMIWASAFQAIKIAVPHLGPVWLVAARVGIGFLALVPWTLYRGILLPKTAQQWGIIGGLVALNVLVPFFLISWAELTISSAETALLMGSGPLIALIVSHFFTDDDKMNAGKLLAVLVGFSGLALIIGVDAIRALGTNTLAQLAALTASMCYASSGLLIRRLEGIPPTRATTIVLGLASAVFIPFAALTQPLPEAVPPAALWAVLYLGLFPTGIAYLLRFHLIRRMGMSLFSHVGNLIPVFGVAFGAVLLGEPVTLTMLAAMALILCGVMLARQAARRMADAQPPQ